MPIVPPTLPSPGAAIRSRARPGSDRGYYLVQDEDGVSPGNIGGIGTIIGNNFGDVGIAGMYDQDGTWLYVAATIDLTAGFGLAEIDAYAANLSLGETAVTQVLNGKQFNTADPGTLAGISGVFGIGGFAIDRDGNGVAEASQEWFQGTIDYIAIYDGLLEVASLNDHLTSRVPEPGAWVLLGLALAGLAVTHRHRVAVG